MTIIEQQRSILCEREQLGYYETVLAPNSQSYGLESLRSVELSLRKSGNEHQANSEQIISGTLKEVPVYDTHMISLDPYNFPTGAQLLAKPKESGSTLQSSTSEVSSHNPDEGKRFLQGSFSSPSSVTSIKTENWGSTSDQLGFGSPVGESHQEASPTNFTGPLTSGNGFVVGSGPSKLFTADCGRGRMASYLSGSNVQADTMQTLYLMNPSYTGYGDSSNTGNMVLISPGTAAVGQGSPLGNPGQQQQQQQYIGFTLPPALTQSPLSQSHIDAMSSSNIGHQNASSNIFTRYSWNGGNELSFLPSSDVTEDNHPLAARFNALNSGQHSTSDMTHYGVRNLSQSSLQDQVPLISNDVALGLNMENLQASTGAGQILSLSLSPQEPSLIQLQSFPIQHSESGVSNCPGFSNAGIDNNLKGDRLPNKCNGGSLSSFKASPRESMLGTGFQIQLNGAGSNRQINMLSSSPTVEIYNSKYLKAAQQLLNEVVSVGRGVKNNAFKHTQLQSWMAPSTVSEGSFPKGRNVADNNGKDGAPVVSWTSAKEGGPTVTALPTSTAGVTEHTENVVELTPAEKQELQLKKAKLMAMLDEVDRRYKQYYHQMQIVVASFESAAGVGAARTYTTLALQTISKHFRCLKDAISGQIRDTNRALGEEEISGQGRGEVSRLRFVDQQLRQQRALQQLGMMQQHAWRPQRGLPERSVSVLRAWLFDNFLHPYPKDSDKILLARQTGLTRSQVSNWFINARVRLWKPMVEEMYTEEVRDGGDAEGPDKPAQGEGENVSRGSMMDGAGNSETKQVIKDAKVFDGNSEGFLMPKNTPEHTSDMLQNRNVTGSSSESFLVPEKEISRQGVKKARNGVQDSASLLSPNSSTGVDFIPNEVHGEDVLEHDMKMRIEDKPREKYGLPHSGLIQADHQNVGGYGSFQVSGLNRYSQEGLAAMYAANSGVSLTLGLQHSESSPLSGGQQHYIQGHGHLLTGRRQESGGSQPNYYSVNENRAGHNSYEAMNIQNQKRFATHMLHHDFSG